MNKSETIGELANALSMVQGKLEPAAKDAANPFFRSSYSTLNSIWDACRQLLTENGLAVSQINESVNDGVIVETILMHKSGEWISGQIYLPLTKQDAQGVGSAITYGRRYGLAAIIGIISDEDDDGNRASQPPKQNQQSQKQQTASTLRERILKAQDAIKNLGGKLEPFDLANANDEQRQSELEALTAQYKRLKATKESK